MLKFLLIGKEYNLKPFVVTPSEYLQILKGRKIDEIRKIKPDEIIKKTKKSKDI